MQIDRNNISLTAIAKKLTLCFAFCLTGYVALDPALQSVTKVFLDAQKGLGLTTYRFPSPTLYNTSPLMTAAAFAEKENALLQRHNNKFTWQKNNVLTDYLDAVIRRYYPQFFIQDQPRYYITLTENFSPDVFKNRIAKSFNSFPRANKGFWDQTFLDADKLEEIYASYSIFAHEPQTLKNIRGITQSLNNDFLPKNWGEPFFSVLEINSQAVCDGSINYETLCTPHPTPIADLYHHFYLINVGVHELTHLISALSGDMVANTRDKRRYAIHCDENRARAMSAIFLLSHYGDDAYPYIAIERAQDSMIIQQLNYTDSFQKNSSPLALSDQTYENIIRAYKDNPARWKNLDWAALLAEANKFSAPLSERDFLRMDYATNKASSREELTSDLFHSTPDAPPANDPLAIYFDRAKLHQLAVPDDLALKKLREITNYPYLQQMRNNGILRTADVANIPSYTTTMLPAHPREKMLGTGMH